MELFIGRVISNSMTLLQIAPSSDTRINRFHHQECLQQTTNGIILILQAPITTTADDKFWDIFPNFRQK